ncbi:Dabb family protein [Naasia sp. SYSU D00948]|uniref:Dabb family protein n=1 Tax=Naasia sp. SYSU D00948 TaxID=2817379 RepID=UPI001B304BE4|nr:Dabb family protein [Naasia sp. SYSU D00948]
MIRHVVLWKLSSSDPSQRERDAEGIRERLEALVGVVPGLRSLIVAPDVGSTEGNWDLVLVSEHDDEDALAVYQKHPAHVEAAAFVHSVVQARACVDAPA